MRKNNDQKTSPRAMDRTRRIGKKVDGTKMSEGRSTISEIGLEIIGKKSDEKQKNQNL